MTEFVALQSAKGAATTVGSSAIVVATTTVPAVGLAISVQVAISKAAVSAMASGAMAGHSVAMSGYFLAKTTSPSGGIHNDPHWTPQLKNVVQQIPIDIGPGITDPMFAAPHAGPTTSQESYLDTLFQPTVSPI
jgi:hypothetical protein